jgi:hypothetical protein
MDGSHPICYWQGRAKDFMDPNPKIRWVPLLNDSAVDEVEEHFKAGMISIRLTIHNATENGPLKHAKDSIWNKKPPKRLRALKVRAYMYQCKDLPSADSDGQTDSYI